MISSLIVVLELGLFSLLLLLAFRVLSLNRREACTPAMPKGTADHAPPVNSHVLDHPDRPGLIPQLHILASLQVRDCKQQAFDLETAHPTVREYAVCWFYGAACALNPSGTGNTDRLAFLVSQLASRKIGIGQPEALSALSTITRQSASLACFRSGIEGAKFWQTHQFVPRDKSLFEAVNSNALV